MECTLSEIIIQDIYILKKITPDNTAIELKL